jgi:hypothetical protein
MGPRSGLARENRGENQRAAPPPHHLPCRAFRRSDERTENRRKRRMQRLGIFFGIYPRY